MIYFLLLSSYVVMIWVCTRCSCCIDRIFLSDDRTGEDDQDRDRNKYRRRDDAVMAGDDGMVDEYVSYICPVRDIAWH